MKRGLIIALAAAAMAFGVNVRAEQTNTVSDVAVMCPKCETVWVKTPKQVGAKVVTYVSTKKMKCEDCKNAVASFLASGKFEHTCKTCGDLVMCKMHAEPTSGPAPSDSKFVPGPGHQKR